MVAMVMTEYQYLFDDHMNEKTWYSEVHKALSYLIAEMATAFGQHLYIRV